jgi:hypothetical protein
MEFADRIPIKITHCFALLNYPDLSDPRLDRSPSHPLHPRMLNGLAAPTGGPKTSVAQ